MATIFPFRGYRYNPDLIKDPALVVTQPYDKIDKEKQVEYYRKNEYNIVRIILGKDGDKEDRYQLAASYLNNWIKEGILVRDSEPALYAYWQEYEVEGVKKVRKGFVGLGKLEDEEGVKAHENTMEGPKVDRLNLLRATEANLGQIFMLYSDPERVIINLLDEALGDRAPLISANDEDGNRHLLWKITDKEIISQIQELMKDKTLYIADGHHRYQTAVTYMKECQRKGWVSRGVEGFENRLMTFVNIDDPGLCILPTHRLIYGLNPFEPGKFLEKLLGEFKINAFESKEDLYEEMENQKDRHIFGFMCKGLPGYYTLTLRDEMVMERLLPEASKSWRNLDVVILHKAILERHLHIDEKALNEKKYIDYVRHRSEALRQFLIGDYQAVFLLNPTKVAEVKQVADEGERMPQKSTDFYPKLLTGLVIHKLEIDKQNQN